jgi:23S rRNA (adenine-N6)-dimethyltransferase
VAAGAGPWGWHRLDESWASRIVGEAGVKPGDLVLDIGAGKGALTGHLVQAGARVIAIELHPGRAEHLRSRFRDAQVKVVQADAGRKLLLPHRPFRVVANPPYGISTALITALTARGSRLIRADLVLQRALVRRVSVPGRWLAHPGMPVPRKAFSPPPRVDSEVLILRQR